MPASMIRADSGFRLKVIGSSIAMVATGPMPGSTPISVPRMQPTRQYSRLVKVNATPKPSERLLIRSMVVFLSTRDEGRPDLDLELERPDECDVAADGQHGGEHEHLLEVEFVAGQA